jgi:hypothetical protein
MPFRKVCRRYRLALGRKGSEILRTNGHSEAFPDPAARQPVPIRPHLPQRRRLRTHREPAAVLLAAEIEYILGGIIENEKSNGQTIGREKNEPHARGHRRGFGDRSGHRVGDGRAGQEEGRKTIEAPEIIRSFKNHTSPLFKSEYPSYYSNRPGGGMHPPDKIMLETRVRISFGAHIPLGEILDWIYWTVGGETWV